jgi:hypothetical protein
MSRAVATQAVARRKPQSQEIFQRLGVMTLVFVVMGENLRSAVVKTYKAIFLRANLLTV